jgi:anti-sigma factor (TIGR02949 family)
MMGTDLDPQEDSICPFVLEQVNLFLDNELDEATADLIRRHLAECESCSDEVVIWELIRKVLKRAYHPSPAPLHLLERITAQIRAAQINAAPLVPPDDKATASAHPQDVEGAEPSLQATQL